MAASYHVKIGIKTGRLRCLKPLLVTEVEDRHQSTGIGYGHDEGYRDRAWACRSAWAAAKRWQRVVIMVGMKPQSWVGRHRAR